MKRIGCGEEEVDLLELGMEEGNAEMLIGGWLGGEEGKGEKFFGEAGWGELWRGDEGGLDGGDFADGLTTGEEELKEACLEEEMFCGEERLGMVGMLQLEIGEEDIAGEVDFELGPRRLAGLRGEDILEEILERPCGDGCVLLEVVEEENGGLESGGGDQEKVKAEAGRSAAQAKEAWEKPGHRLQGAGSGVGGSDVEVGEAGGWGKRRMKGRRAWRKEFWGMATRSEVGSARYWRDEPREGVRRKRWRVGLAWGSLAGAVSTSSWYCHGRERSSSSCSGLVKGWRRNCWTRMDWSSLRRAFWCLADCSGKASMPEGRWMRRTSRRAC